MKYITVLILIACMSGCVSLSHESCHYDHWKDFYHSEEHPKKYKVNDDGKVICNNCLRLLLYIITS